MPPPLSLPRRMFAVKQSITILHTWLYYTKYQVPGTVCIFITKYVRRRKHRVLGFFGRFILFYCFPCFSFFSLACRWRSGRPSGLHVRVPSMSANVKGGVGRFIAIRSNTCFSFFLFSSVGAFVLARSRFSTLFSLKHDSAPPYPPALFCLCATTTLCCLVFLFLFWCFVV